MIKITGILILVFYGFVFGYIFRLIQEYHQCKKSGVPKMRNIPKPPKKKADI